MQCPLAVKQEESMNIHEYQAKEVLRDYGVTTQPGHVFETIESFETYARKEIRDRVVIKAQVHAGGRGLAGGVKLASTADEAIDIAKALFGKQLVTHQTDHTGLPIHKLYLEPACEIEREFYLSMLVDRKTATIVLVASREGGMSIEAVAAETPDAIAKLQIQPSLGIRPHHVRQVMQCFQLPTDQFQAMTALLNSLLACFMAKDVSLLELNPLVLTKDEQLVALDAKISFDDNALFRHREIKAFRDIAQEDAKEVEAGDDGLSYVSLDGEIGCLVNGAGLAMATMDAIHFAGGKPANFLDVGGSADAHHVKKALDIILRDSQVKGVLINIFGGIMQCDTIAEGLLRVLPTIERDLPFVVRLEGTNVERGRKMLEESPFDIHTANSLDEGAEKMIALTQ
ncbi:ADP-forming succinate--CoA ligase subunit beta [Fusibacter paucivorans]|uniref:Succinate--CoA ligase [ADP-forming] subunit beta n=1 Tax=Fusibacter paucivorans TaxID=76009 RepID=A0ABS5PL96_9FIRM|nr:ADP-forming succinate--CoA ligase subunit beta [Fusibacter paucivorans]MBS7525096.1 ADP-forming succinate--CoA ligase subunit beta [Fusibacter paucivorans]